MLKNSLLFCLFIIGLSLTSCYEDLIVENKSTESFDPEVSYLNEIRGTVIDTFGTAIANVRVRIENVEGATDNEGRFTLYDVPVQQYGSYLDVSKNGYYDTGVRVYPNDGLKLAASIVMVETDESFGFDTGVGSMIEHRSGLQVDISPNSFSKNGTIYNGQAFVNIFWVDPNNLNNYRQKPQVYESLSTAGDTPYDKPSFLSTAYISVTDDSGVPLDVVPESPVIVNFPAPTKNQDFLQYNNQLLSLTDEDGLWIVEGSTEQNGDYFKAELTHFSWWTVAYTQKGASLCIDYNGPEAAIDQEQLFTVSKTDGSIVFLGSVSLDADICIPIPIDEELEIRVYSYCFQLLGSFTYSGTSDETGEITIDLTPRASIASIIEGRVIGCNGAPYNGPVEISYSTDRSQDVLGTFSETFEISLDPCFPYDVLYIVARDTANNLIGSTEVNINESSDSQQNVDITICEEVSFFSLGEANYDNVVGRNNKEETLIIVTTTDERIILMGIDGFSEGSFSARLFDELSNVCEGSATLTKYGEIGETIEGSFEMPTNNLGCPGYKGTFVATREK